MTNDFISKYNVKKFNFSDEEKFILEELRDNLIDLAIQEKMSSFNEDLILKDIIRFLDNRLQNRFDYGYKENLAENMLKELIGYGEISSLIDDDDLEEIMVIGVNKPVFVYHRKYGMMETDLFFDEEAKIINITDSIARQTNRRIDQQSPILDARLEDGSRVNATIPPLSANGPTITIRKFKKDPLTIVDLIKYNTLNSEMAAFLWLCVDGLGVKPANIIVSGGTSSGKTTLLNALSIFINPKERMVKNSLRQRPDRIIVGEVRGKEAITLFTALNTGHSRFGTLHANNSRETITRLTNAPMNVPKIMISSIDFIIMEKRIYRSDGISFRRITEIAEVVGIEEGTVQLSKLFEWDSEKDEFRNLTIVSKTLEDLANLKGVRIHSLNEEWKNRKKVLDFLVKNNISSQKDISEILETYYLDSDFVLNEINA